MFSVVCAEQQPAVVLYFQNSSMEQLTADVSYTDANMFIGIKAHNTLNYDINCSFNITSEFNITTTTQKNVLIPAEGTGDFSFQFTVNRSTPADTYIIRIIACARAVSSPPSACVNSTISSLVKVSRYCGFTVYSDEQNFTLRQDDEFNTRIIVNNTGNGPDCIDIFINSSELDNKDIALSLSSSHLYLTAFSSGYFFINISAKPYAILGTYSIYINYTSEHSLYLSNLTSLSSGIVKKTVIYKITINSREWSTIEWYLFAVKAVLAIGLIAVLVYVIIKFRKSLVKK
ncbi:MAG: hypothetical protein QW728_06295 [Thermoplasmata archaeon]